MDSHGRKKETKQKPFSMAFYGLYDLITAIRSCFLFVNQENLLLLVSGSRFQFCACVLFEKSRLVTSSASVFNIVLRSPVD